MYLGICVFSHELILTANFIRWWKGFMSNSYATETIHMKVKCADWVLKYFLFLQSQVLCSKCNYLGLFHLTLSVYKIMTLRKNRPPPILPNQCHFMQWFSGTSYKHSSAVIQHLIRRITKGTVATCPSSWKNGLSIRKSECFEVRKFHHVNI